jgi:ribosomal RNA-processing protein 36
LQVDREWRGEERAATERGKKKFYLKASDKKRLVLAKKFERLEAAGKFEKYAEKKRKKNASRDHKKLPFQAK